jgi:DNA-binding transcriptional MerR regulator
MSEESLRIIIEFFGIVITAVLTYLFTRSHYERKRRDDLADRDFIRRATVYDMKIKKVRDYVDTLQDIFSLNARVISTLLSPDGLTLDVVTEIEQQSANLVDLHEKASKQVLDTYGLGDAEFKSLHSKVSSISKTNKVAETTGTILKRGRSNADIKKLKKLQKANALAEIEIMHLKARLDKLAETVPNK